MGDRILVTGSTPQLAFAGGTTLSPAGVLAASLTPSLSSRALYALGGGTTPNTVATVTQQGGDAIRFGSGFNIVNLVSGLHGTQADGDSAPPSTSVSLGSGNTDLTINEDRDFVVQKDGGLAATVNGNNNLVDKRETTSNTELNEVAVNGNDNAVRTNLGTGQALGDSAGDTGNIFVLNNPVNAVVTSLGRGDAVFLNGGTAGTIADRGQALTLTLGPNAVNSVDGALATLSGAGSDRSLLIDLAAGLGGYATVAGVLSALHGDGNGGTSLPLGAGELDIAGIAPAVLTAATSR